MAKQYELIYRVPGNIYRQKIFCGISLILCLQMCVNMALLLLVLPYQTHRNRYIFSYVYNPKKIADK